MSSNLEDQLNWLATQYVLGELSDVDRDSFESRLADDLDACEAVARATLLTISVRQALEAMPSPVALTKTTSATTRRSQIAVGISVATVASLLVAMAVWSPNATESVSGVASRSNEAAELVSRWRSEMKLADADADDLDDDIHENSAEVTVPGWLFAGVILEKHGSIDGQQEEVQEN